MNTIDRLKYAQNNWFLVQTAERDVIKLSIWIEENLGGATEAIHGDCLEGNDIYFKEADAAMAFKLVWS